MLIVYYSWSNGNTEGIATQLQQAVGGELEKLQMVTPYSGSYDDVVAQGQQEVNRGFQPRLVPMSVNVEDYDIVAIGTPTWWYTMAPPVLTFLKSVNWKGKTVVPFMTHGGWPGHVIEDIKKACAGANFGPAMEIRFDSTGGAELVTAQTDIETWIQEVKKSEIRRNHDDIK